MEKKNAKYHIYGDEKNYYLFMDQLKNLSSKAVWTSNNYLFENF